MQQYPKGFGVNVSIPGSAPERQFGKDREPRAALLASVGTYLVRTPLTESRLVAYAGGKVTMRHRGYEFGETGLLHKKVDPDFEELDALELLARLSVHVPLPRKHHTRYAGAYSTRFRGRMRKLGLAPRPEAEGKLRKECRQARARLIKHLYQDDPLKCPECGEQMKLIRLVSRSSLRSTDSPRERACCSRPAERAARDAWSLAERAGLGTGKIQATSPVASLLGRPRRHSPGAVTAPPLTGGDPNVEKGKPRPAPPGAATTVCAGQAGTARRQGGQVSGGRRGVKPGNILAI